MVDFQGEIGGPSVDPFVDAFESAKASDGLADLADFLPEPGLPLYVDVRCELVRIDLEYHWTRDRPVPLEEYLARFPVLASAPDLLRQAAFEEYRLRRQAGEDPTADEYRRRFGLVEPSWIWPRTRPPGHERPRTEAGHPADRDNEGPGRYAHELDVTGPMSRPDATVGTLERADPGTASLVAEALRSPPTWGRTSQGSG